MLVKAPKTIVCNRCGNTAHKTRYSANGLFIVYKCERGHEVFCKVELFKILSKHKEAA